MRGFFIGLPVITIIALAITIGGLAYFKQIRVMVEKSEPKIIQELRDSNKSLEKKLEDQVTLVKTLTEKLSAPTTEGIQLNLFTPPIGMQDKTATPILDIENLDLQSDNRSVQVKFNIVNLDQEGKRLSGHIFIVLKTGSEFYIYPQENMNARNFAIKYNEGESFAASRFRPVQVDFKDVLKSNDQYLIRILIFSRSGDLLFNKIVTSTR